MDMLADESDDQEDILLSKEAEGNRKVAIDRALQELTPREREVISGRFFAGVSKTLQDVGDELGITRERVRQLESNALKKLHKILGADAELLVAG